MEIFDSSWQSPKQDNRFSYNLLPVTYA